MRSTHGDDATVGRTDPHASRQLIRQHLSLVHDAITVCINESLHRSRLLFLRLQDRFGGSGKAPDHLIQLTSLVQFFDVVLALQIVAVQFGDEEVASLIPTHTRGLTDQRFGGHQFQLEAWRNSKKLGTLCGR